MDAIDRLRTPGAAAVEPAPAVEPTTGGARRERRSWKRRLMVMGGIGALTLGVGVAEAAWTANGSGNGATKGQAANPVGVSATGSPSLSLYPGANADVLVTVTNTNPYPVQITEIDAGLVSGITAKDAVTNTTISACSGNATGISYNWSAKTLTSPVNLAANTGTYTFDITGTGSTNTGAVTMSNASDASCGIANGVNFFIPVTVKAASVTPVTTTTSTGSPLTVTVP